MKTRADVAGRRLSGSPRTTGLISEKLAVFIPASGWLGDRFGGKRVLLTAIAVFSVASALCGLASSLGELVAFRILQGAGGGMLAPVGMAMLYRAFPPRERIRAAAILTVPTTFAPALGPVRGGVPGPGGAAAAGPVRPGGLPAVRAGPRAGHVRGVRRAQPGLAPRRRA